jgi:hypothetical protein
MRAKEFLLEYNRQITAQNLGQSMFNTFVKEGPSWWSRLSITADLRNPTPAVRNDVINQLLVLLERTDPTPHKEYVQWLARTYARGGVHFEDVITQVNQDLANFDRLKKRRLIKPPYNDINRYSDFHLFAETVAQYEDQTTANDQLKQNRGKFKELYKDAQLRVIQPEDYEAACYYGKGSKWCTSGSSEVSANMFDRYNSEGPLYIIIPAQAKYAGEKYQFHFPSMQFMNEKDRSIDVHELVSRYPQLAKLFNDQAKKYGALQFFFSQDEVKKIMELLLPRIVTPIRTYITLNIGKITKEIAADLIGQFPGLKSLREDLFEILPDDVRNSIEYYYRAVAEDAKMHPEILYNIDAFWDMTLESDRLREFASNSEIAVFIHEMLDIDDEEGSFEIDQSLNGTLQGYYAKAVHEAWKKLSEQYLKI